MPYTSMPAWPDSLRPGSVESRLLHHDLLPRLLERREGAPARAAPERAESHEGVHRAREEALRGDRLRQVPRHARSGRRTFGSNPEGRLGPSDTRGGPRAELDLPGRVVPRGHLPDDEHGAQRHAHAVVRSTRSRPSNDGRSPTSSPRSRGATGLAIPTSSSPSTSRIRSIWRRGPRASHPLLSPAFRSSGRSWSPDARSILPRPRVTVQAIYDAESIALLVRWHDMSAEKTGKNGPSLPVPLEEEEEAAAAAARRGRAAARRRSVFGDEEVAAAPAGQAQPGRTPLPRRQRRQPAQPSEFSDAVAIQIPSQVPTGARKPYFIFGDAQNSVDLWFFDLARPDPLQFTGKGSADIAPNDTGDLTGVASYDQGEWSVIFKRPLRPSVGRRVHARRVHADRLLGLGRVLARAWQPARSHGLVLRSTSSPKSVPSAVGPMVQDGAVHPRHRAGRDRLGAVASRLSRPRGARR